MRTGDEFFMRVFRENDFEDFGPYVVPHDVDYAAQTELSNDIGDEIVMLLARQKPTEVTEIHIRPMRSDFLGADSLD